MGGVRERAPADAAPSSRSADAAPRWRPGGRGAALAQLRQAFPRKRGRQVLSSRIRLAMKEREAGGGSSSSALV